MSDISSISSSVSVGSSSNGADQLEKLKADLQKQITTEQASKDDDKVKALKIAQLQQQVQAVDAEIQAQQAKSSKKDAGDTKAERPKSKQPDPDPSKILDTTI
jgi:uncharacterized small protein (DUF1192 family)